MNKVLKNYGFPFVMILFFVLDIANFLIDREAGLSSSNSISYYGKGLIEVLFLIQILLFGTYKRSIAVLMLIFGLIAVAGFCSQYIGRKDEVDLNQLFQIIKELNKYIFPIILFLGLQSTYVNLRNVQIVFETIYLVSASIVILSALFDLSYFYTYNKMRFGFKPPFSTQNEITFFWMIGITYFGNVMNNEIYVRNILKFTLIFLASVLLGTKAILLFLSLFAIYFLFWELKIWVKVKLIVLTVLIFMFLGFIYASGILSYFYELFNEQGIAYAFTSKRNILFIERVIPLLEDWHWYNYAIGGTWIRMPITEMDMVDLFLFSGGLGFILFFYTLNKTIFSFSWNNKIGWFFVVQFVLIGALAGHVFSSGINAIYLAVLCFYLQYNDPVKTIEVNNSLSKLWMI